MQSEESSDITPGIVRFKANLRIKPKPVILKFFTEPPTPATKKVKDNLNKLNQEKI